MATFETEFSTPENATFETKFTSGSGLPGGDIYVPTKLSELENDIYAVCDEHYVHTDNNFTDEDKEKVQNLDDTYATKEQVGKANEVAEDLEQKCDSGYFNGKDGKDGQDGYTPQKGVDYWTTADIAEIQSYIDTQLGVIENGTY